MSSAVSRPVAADSAEALVHFHNLLRYETDCWDVHHAVSNQRQDFILVDVRSEALFEQGHLPESINLPQHRISAKTLASYTPDTLFVVYCAGPHCNGGDRGALALARLERCLQIRG